VRVSLGVFAGVQLSDNVNYSDADPQSDLILRSGITTGFQWPATEKSELRFNGGFGYAHYLAHPEFDALEITPDSALAWEASFEDGKLTLFDRFSYSQQVITESAISGVPTFPRFDNTVGTKVTWLPDHWLLEGGYSHNDFFSDSTAYQYLDRASEYLFLRAGWRFAEVTQAGLEASSSFTAYRLHIQSDNYSVSVGPFADWQVTQALRATMRAGWTSFVFDSSGGSPQNNYLSSYYLGFELSDQLTEFIWQRLNVQHDVRLGIYAGSDYIEELSASYLLDWALTRYWTFELNFGFEHGNQPQSGAPVAQETYDRFTAGPALSWQMTQKVSCFLGYSFWQRTSNLQGRNYVQNSLTLRLTYDF
jgi:hypothetical protein